MKLLLLVEVFHLRHRREDSFFFSFQTFRNFPVEDTKIVINGETQISNVIAFGLPQILQGVPTFLNVFSGVCLSFIIYKLLKIVTMVVSIIYNNKNIVISNGLTNSNYIYCLNVQYNTFH